MATSVSESAATVGRLDGVTEDVGEVSIGGRDFAALAGVWANNVMGGTTSLPGWDTTRSWSAYQLTCLELRVTRSSSARWWARTMLVAISSSVVMIQRWAPERGS